MAQFRYFAAFKGDSVTLANVYHDGSMSTSAEHFYGQAPDGTTLQCQRKVDFKANPSLHKCGARCVSAKGFKCECSCGGRNHGRGQS